jgi:hypothetical protein
MMKKVILVATVATFMFSCGGGVSTPCDCANALEDYGEAYKEAQTADDKAKLDELNAKFEQLDKDCKAISKEMGKEKYREEFEKCLGN